MVSLRTLALLAALPAVPALTQQLRLSSAAPNSSPLGKAVHAFVMQNAQLPFASSPAVRPKPTRLTPRKFVATAPQTQGGKCSIPLLNALAGRVRRNELRMPSYAPHHVDPMPNVQPPAPPCKNWPPK